MSKLASSSYTAKATIWPLTGKDEWGGDPFGEPVVIDCDYGARSSRITTPASGLEIAVNLYVWTEYPHAKVGDMLAIGEHHDPTPVPEADVVVLVGRDADTFYRTDDDYEIATGTRHAG